MDASLPKSTYTGPERRRGPRLSQAAWRRQERACSYTHGIAAVLSLGALALLLEAAVHKRDIGQIFSFLVFGCSMVVLFSASAFLHSLPLGKERSVFGDFDLAGIFLMIAGTYTPFTLVTLRGPLGWWLFGIIWTLAIVGVLGMLKHKKLFERVAAYIYLVMGWLIVIAIRPLAHNLPTPGLVLLISGGLAYSFGVIFFLWERWLYHHVIWHIFVMLGSFCHFLAVLLYVYPDVRNGVFP
jgi:hemolysin III